MTLRSRFRISRLILGLLLLAGLAAAAWWALRPITVPVYRVQEGTLVQAVVASGQVLPAARVQIGSELTGVVNAREAEAGAIVGQGTVLASLVDHEWQARVREAEAALRRLNDADWPQAREAVTEAQSRLAQIQRETQRRRELVAARAESREALERAEHDQVSAASALAQARLRLAALAPDGPERALLAARLGIAQTNLARTRIRSTVAGRVLEDRVEVGDLVQPGQVLFIVAAAGRREVESHVDERYLDVLREGQPARVVADAFPGQPFDATLERLAPRVDPERGAVKLTFSLPDPVPDFLRDEMTVTVSIETGRATDSLWLPRDAIQFLAADRGRVAVLTNGRVDAREVELGLAGDHAVVVSSGVVAGDMVLLNPDQPAGARARAQVLDAPAPANTLDEDRNAVPMRF